MVQIYEWGRDISEKLGTLNEVCNLVNSVEPMLISCFNKWTVIILTLREVEEECFSILCLPLQNKSKIISKSKV